MVNYYKIVKIHRNDINLKSHFFSYVEEVAFLSVKVYSIFKSMNICCKEQL